MRLVFETLLGLRLLSFGIERHRQEHGRSGGRCPWGPVAFRADPRPCWPHAGSSGWLGLQDGAGLIRLLLEGAAAFGAP